MGLAAVLILIVGVQMGYPLLTRWQLQVKRQKELQEKKMVIFKWEEILAAKPDFRDGWLKLAVSYLEIGAVQKAKEALDKAKELDPNYEKIKEIEDVLVPGFEPGAFRM